jgi:hypothetical protein
MIAREPLLKTLLNSQQLLLLADSKSIAYSDYNLFESAGYQQNPAVNQFCQ